MSALTDWTVGWSGLPKATELPITETQANALKHKRVMYLCPFIASRCDQLSLILNSSKAKAPGTGSQKCKTPKHPLHLKNPGVHYPLNGLGGISPEHIKWLISAFP
jgi:hypothetical protein